MLQYPGAEAIINMTGLKSGERVLVLSDNKTSAEAIAIIEQVCIDCGVLVLINRDLPLEFCDEMPDGFESIMQGFDVIILAASQSWYHTNARRKAKYEWRKRVVECYGLVKESLVDGGLVADYNQVARKGEELSAIFKGEKFIRIVSGRGTEFTCDIECVGVETGQYQNPGSGGNLPAGEVFIVPVPETANGRVVFDISMDLFGHFHEEVLGVDIKAGKIVNVFGEEASILEKAIIEDCRIANVAEVAFGVNEWAKCGRSILEDEKKYGTAHIGFGNDTYFGGGRSGPHYDGVFLLDGKPEEGKFST